MARGCAAMRGGPNMARRLETRDGLMMLRGRVLMILLLLRIQPDA